MSPIRAGYPQIWKLFLDILFPIPCAGCGATGKSICDKCLSKIPHLDTYDKQKIIASVPYKSDTISKAITRFKFSGEKHFAPIFADLVLPLITNSLTDIAEINPLQKLHWVICPIPTSKKRKAKRGFNPPALICEEIIMKIALDGISYENLLVREKDDISQSKTETRAERFKNLSHAFRAINAQRKNVIVIDDVATTGATLLEAERALKEGGADRILLFALAH